jgi:hypothetical protein
MRQTRLTVSYTVIHHLPSSKACAIAAGKVPNGSTFLFLLVSLYALISIYVSIFSLPLSDLSPAWCRFPAQPTVLHIYMSISNRYLSVNYNPILSCNLLLLFFAFWTSSTATAALNFCTCKRLLGPCSVSEARPAQPHHTGVSPKLGHSRLREHERAGDERRRNSQPFDVVLYIHAPFVCFVFPRFSLSSLLFILSMSVPHPSPLPSFAFEHCSSPAPCRM